MRQKWGEGMRLGGNADAVYEYHEYTMGQGNWFGYHGDHGRGRRRVVGPSVGVVIMCMLGDEVECTRSTY